MKENNDTWNERTDIIRRIYSKEVESHAIDVKPHPMPTHTSVVITPASEKSIEYFGFNSLIVSTEFAKLLGNAILDCADEIEL